MDLNSVRRDVMRRARAAWAGRHFDPMWLIPLAGVILAAGTLSLGIGFDQKKVDFERENLKQFVAASDFAITMTESLRDGVDSSFSGAVYREAYASDMAYEVASMVKDPALYAQVRSGLKERLDALKLVQALARDNAPAGYQPGFGTLIGGLFAAALLGGAWLLVRFRREWQPITATNAETDRNEEVVGSAMYRRRIVLVTSLFLITFALSSSGRLLDSSFSWDSTSNWSVPTQQVKALMNADSKEVEQVISYNSLMGAASLNFAPKSFFTADSFSRPLSFYWDSQASWANTELKNSVVHVLKESSVWTPPPLDRWEALLMWGYALIIGAAVGVLLTGSRNKESQS